MNKESKIEKIKVKTITRILKGIGWFVILLGLTLLLTILLIQVPGIQRVAKNKVTTYLEDKFGTPVQIGRLSITFPKLLVLQQIYIADRNKDTLLYGKELSINLRMLGLIKGDIIIDEIALHDVKVNLLSDSAGVFNFAHILDAFGSNNTSPNTQTEGEPLEIQLENIKLNRVRFNYLDQSSGIDSKFYIGHLRAGFEKFDITNQIFTLKNFAWYEGDVDLNMWQVAKNPVADDELTASNTTKSRLPVFQFKEADLTEIDFKYTNKDDGMDMLAFIGKFDAEGLNLELNKQLIELGNSNISYTNFTYQSSTPAYISNGNDVKSPNWIITSKDISLLESWFNYDDQSQPRLPKGMDYSHLSFSKVNLKGNGLYVSGGDTVSANINKGALHEKSGFVLNSLETELFYTPKGIRLGNLNLTTPHSSIKEFMEVGYESTSQASENPGELWLSAIMKNARIGHKDMLTVVPLLNDYPMFADYPNATMQVDGKITGQLKDLALDAVTFKGFGGTTIRASGRITGLPDPDKISTNLNIKKFVTTDADIRKIIPAGLIPDYIVLPASASLKGSITGSVTNRLTIDIAMASSLGGAAVKGFIKNADNPQKAKYDLKGNLSSFDIGKLISNNDIGKVSIRFDANGNTYDPNTLTGNYGAFIYSLEYLGTTYKNIDIVAKADNGIINSTAFSKENAHMFDLVLNANLRGAFPSVSSRLNIDTLDLQYLGFSDVPLKFAVSTQMDFARLDIDNPEGYFFMTGLRGVYDTLNFQFDTLSAIASRTKEGQVLIVKTDFGKADIRGNYSVAKLFPELMQFVNLYYHIGKPVPALSGDQQAKIKMTLYPSEQVQKFIPGLVMTENVKLSLDFDSESCLFDLEGTLPAIKYGMHQISGASFFSKSNDSAIAYKIFIDDYDSEVYQMPTLLIEGDVLQHKLYTAARLLDSLGRLQHTMAAVLEQRENGYAIHFDPNSVLLNYEAWGLDPLNELFISEAGLYANSFTFSNGSQALVLQTFGDSLNDPLGVRLFNFKISTFTSLARQDSLYLDGTINGFAELKLDSEHPFFIADMELSNLLYKKDTIGNIVLNVSNEVEDIYSINAKMTGFENDISIAGEYNGIKSLFDIQIDIEKLMLSTIEPFALGYMNGMAGHIEGGISISGSSNEPVVIGNMLFREAEANIPLLNSAFSLKNERIRFLKDGMHFNGFTLTDANGKKAVLNGAILTKNWFDYRFNLDFEANDFRVINSTRKDNRLFYGKLFLDTKITFSGTSDRPVIAATFRANSNTDLTMVMPQSNPELAEREGVVDFFDARYPDTDSLFAKKIDSLNTTGITGISLSANFEIDQRARLVFVIDEANGDMLVARGRANLSTSIDPSGKISVTGTYELLEGSYDMTVRILKFNFKIQSGSTITWTGDPTAADINVTALYQVNAAPFDLVEQQIQTENSESKTRYRDRIPFNVKLMIKGELLKPDIRFDIEIAETSGSSADVIATVNSKLDQLRIDESQMNQQVFALILLGSFIADNPFASSSGSSGVSSLARQSVSKLLSSQLNQLAGSLISGVDIDIGIESGDDYSTGTLQTRTDLNVAVSKTLLKERLKITVGSNFELEGASRPNEKTTNIAGDIKADYALTRDGRYGLRFYRIDQYEVALQGQVVETGVSFIINIDFDKFREIFEKKKKIGEKK